MRTTVPKWSSLPEDVQEVLIERMEECLEHVLNRATAEKWLEAIFAPVEKEAVAVSLQRLVST